MSLFPLPLVPFEHYMLADDSEEYPMTFFLRLQFQGRFDRDRTHWALASALCWHPLLSALVQGSVHDRTESLMWIAGEGRPPSVVWQSQSAPVTFPNGSRIDLSCETGLRLWFRESDDATELLFQIHHACCDGLGAIQFIETFLDIYNSNGKSNGESQPPPGWEARYALRRQISSGTTACSWREFFLRIGRAFKRIGRYCKTRPAPLAIPSTRRLDDPRTETGHPALLTHFFDEAATSQFRASAKQRNVSANTLMMRELFLALDDWNRTRGTLGKSRPLRIVVPVNLRDNPRERLPAFNAVSLAFIDRQPRELANAQTLLEGLDREVGEAKTLRSRMVLLPVLHFLGRFRNGICHRLQACPCLGSAVFSNLGILFFGSRLLGTDRLVRCGDLVLTKFEAAPPVRRNTLAGIAVSMYGNALTVSLGYDAHCLTPVAASAMLDLYVRRLQSCTDERRDEI